MIHNKVKTGSYENYLISSISQNYWQF